MSKRADPPDGYYGDGGRDAELELNGEDDVYLLLVKWMIT